MWANLVLIGANVLTMDRSQPFSKAIAIKGDRIVQAGTNKKIGKWIGKDTKIISQNGKTVVLV